MTATAQIDNSLKISITMCHPDKQAARSETAKCLPKSDSSQVQHRKEDYLPAIWKCVFATVVLPPVTVAFSLWFPFQIPYTHASLYYEPTSYVYDEEHTRFDNTPLTYVTDYMVAVWMIWGSWNMYQMTRKIDRAAALAPKRNFKHLRHTAQMTCFLLASYAISVIAGGLSHQFFISLDMLNTVEFRIMWSITVGLVTAAAGFIGAIGTHLALYFAPAISIPILPLWMWAYFGAYMTLVCWAGGMSFYRPAVDIFIAGTAQFTPTMYAILALMTRKFHTTDATAVTTTPSNGHSESQSNGTSSTKGSSSSSQPLLSKLDPMHTSPVPLSTRVWFVVAFLLNAPLLPVYPELLWSGLELGVVNAILHFNLALAWGLQYLTLKWICESQIADVVSP